MQKQISPDVFEEQFKPQLNHLDPNASYDGCMLETYGPELRYVEKVLAATPGRVWTILDCDGTSVISSGYQYVNRMGYIITEAPCPDGVMIEVVDEDDELLGEGSEVATPQAFTVSWVINVDAATPVKAAQQALSLMPRDQDDETLSKSFTVIDRHNHHVDIELMPHDNYVATQVDRVVLPFGIVVASHDGGASITSLLADQFAGPDDDETCAKAGKASADAIESLLMALAAEGIDIHTNQFSRAIATAVEAIANNLN